ncbi:MAG: hypothetical protein IT426_07265 [Pirellulales bacterium]|nr:hypothetical protein [Pirellulales bacterium]
MSSPSAANACALCGQPIPGVGRECPACRASVDWQNLVGAAKFAQDRFVLWEKGGLIGGEQLASIASAYNEYRRSLDASFREGKPSPAEAEEIRQMRPGCCWSCNAAIAGSPSHCFACGAPVEEGLVRELRYWNYACRVIKSMFDAHLLPLTQAHACINDAKGRIAALRASLEKQRQPILASVVAEDGGEHLSDSQTAASGRSGATEPTPFPRSPAAASGAAASAARVKKPRRPLMEILLDPRSIQWLLGLGGALLVIGLVIWLATLGIFQNPVVVAVALGIGNAAFLGGGWAITGRTRYQTAGRALTLLACLVMPLNLWFYHAQGLMTLEGHLWVAALVCTVLYAASAMVLRDPTFVYVLIGGITMTGLLMLNTMGRFWEIAAPATFLAVLGMICVHLERAFSENEGPFTRRRFGLAFFWSGHAVLAAGLLLLLGAQIAGNWLYKPFFESLYQSWNLGPPAIVAERWGQLLALALVLAGTYAYVYSDVVVRRIGVYIYLAVFTLLWAEVLVIDLFALKITTEVAIVALALTALVSHAIAPAAIRRQRGLADGGADTPASAIRPLARAAKPLGLLLSSLPVLLGIFLFLRATYKPLNAAWPLHGTAGEMYAIGWLYVAAMFLTAAVCRIGAHLYRHAVAWLATTYFFGTAAATLLGTAGLLSVWGMKTWDELAMVLMVIPILYAISARLYRGHSQENPLMWAGQSATAVILLAALAASVHLTPQHVFEPEIGSRLNLSLSAIFAEAAVFYALAAAFRKRGFNVYLCAAAASGAVWQLLYYWSVGPEYYTLIFALCGFILLVGYRLAIWERTGMAEPAFQCANALLSMSFIAAALITLSRLATRISEVHWSLVLLLLGLTALSLLAAWLVRHAGWRRWYLVAAIVEAALMFLTMHMLSHLNTWEKMEIFGVAIGLALLVVGHIGWHREQDQRDDLVSFSLFLGSMLVAVPLAIAVVLHRIRPEFSPLDELGMLVAGILLLATGFMFHLRSTAITGAALLLIYLLTMVLYINMLENVQTAAIWMTIGGGAIFGTGVLLSIYRDRLLTLPDQVKRREGIFRVLTWR